MTTEHSPDAPEKPMRPQPEPATDAAEQQARAALAHVPRVTDPEWRLACSDVAEALARHTGFRRKVMWPVGLLLAGAVGSVATYFGVTTKHDIEAKLDDAKVAAIKEIGSARAAITNQISSTFKDEKVKAILDKAAADQSALLLSNSVQPSIDSFNAKIDARLAEFDAFLKAQRQAATKDLETLKVELARLQQRNDLTALADKAIGEGNVTAYRELEEMATHSANDERGAAVISELFRVFSAFSAFSPSRSGTVTINAAAVNPKKTKEEELDSDDIIGIWDRVPDGIGRAKLATLLAKSAKPGSFRTADWIAGAIEKETHLEAIRNLMGTFQQVTGHSDGGRLDGTGLLQWWKEHREEFRAKDTDKPTSPPPKPN